MNQSPTDLTRRLLYILHRGWTQARNLALAGDQQQLADLADTLEILPGLIDRWQDDDLALVRSILQAYQEKYPGQGYDYLAQLETRETPERF